MVVRAQIGNCPHVGILVFRLGFFHWLFFPFGDIVDALLTFLSIRVNHWSTIPTPRVALSLHVPLLFAVAAHYIRVAGPIVAGRT